MKIKNSNKNLKIIISIGDTNNLETYDKFCSTEHLMNQFIDSITNIIQSYEIDGFNFNLNNQSNTGQESNLSFLFKQNLVQMFRVS